MVRPTHSQGCSTRLNPWFASGKHNYRLANPMIRHVLAPRNTNQLLACLEDAATENPLSRRQVTAIGIEWFSADAIPVWEWFSDGASNLQDTSTPLIWTIETMSTPHRKSSAEPDLADTMIHRKDGQWSDFHFDYFRTEFLSKCRIFRGQVVLSPGHPIAYLFPFLISHMSKNWFWPGRGEWASLLKRSITLTRYNGSRILCFRLTRFSELFRVSIYAIRDRREERKKSIQKGISIKFHSFVLIECQFFEFSKSLCSGSGLESKT